MSKKTEQRKGKSDFFSSLGLKWLRRTSNQRGGDGNEISTAAENVRNQVVYFPVLKD